MTSIYHRFKDGRIVEIRNWINRDEADAVVGRWLGEEEKAQYEKMKKLRFSDREIFCKLNPDIVDQIGGWTTAGVGQGYGKGYPLTVLRKWMDAIA